MCAFQMGKQVNQICISTSSDSAKEDSTSTMTDSDLMEDDDASSSPSPSPSLKTHLPINIKRGLSKYYEGKSQSFTSLASVKSLEDLPKEEHPYNKRMKLCRSYGGGLDLNLGHNDKRFSTPKHTIAKKSSSTTALLSALMMRRNALLSDISDISVCSRPPINPLHK